MIIMMIQRAYRKPACVGTGSEWTDNGQGKVAKACEAAADTVFALRILASCFCCF